MSRLEDVLATVDQSAGDDPRALVPADRAAEQGAEIEESASFEPQEAVARTSDSHPRSGDRSLPMGQKEAVGERTVGEGTPASARAVLRELFEGLRQLLPQHPHRR